MKQVSRLSAWPGRVFLALMVVGSTGCKLADPSLLEALRSDAASERDGGGSGDDGGSREDGGRDDDAGLQSEVVDECGDDHVSVITDTRENIVIDTRGLVDRINSLRGCNLGVPGNDGFLAVDVQPGEYWHFHLRVDRANDPDPTTRNPTLYLLDESCSSCQPSTLANYCSQDQDEHFAITFSSAGRWYIGVDDTNPGGGVFLLDAIRPSCGNTLKEHGEACDEAGEGCSSTCRWILDETSAREKGDNINFDEANIVSPDKWPLDVSGDIGGFSGCKYPDVFVIEVADAQTLEVMELPTSGGQCAELPNEPSEIKFTLLDASNDEQQVGALLDPITNCHGIEFQAETKRRSLLSGRGGHSIRGGIALSLQTEI